MSKLVRKIIGLVLVLTLVAAQVLIPMPMQVNATEAWNYSGNSSAATDIQAGVTLHCWNWSYENIEKNMALIASLGYTAIQTSPIQQAKQATAGFPMADWWVYYQPAAFQIDNTGNSALGNKAQFKSMCETAHKYGIYVIVDVVANHLANGNTENTLSGAIPADIRNDSSCWHDYSRNISNYYDRYNITQYCLDGVPDLNTSNSKIQNYVLNYLKECIDAGADGFRFDAVKHIETPDDAYCASNFWPTVINGAKSYATSSRGLDLYCYGELLYHPDEGGSLSDGAYTKYMNITDNSWSNTVRNNVVGSGNAGAFGSGYHKNANSNQLVLWAESHDNWAGDGTRGVSVQNINKTWALAAARSDAMSLYLARPENTYPQLLGTVSMTGWSYAEVGAVNHFHNFFHGQSEYVSNMNNIAYVERGNSGVVLVNCGGTSTSVNVAAHTMANGTYTDQITGNTFTVSGGRIKGNIGSTGIAVVYNASTCKHDSHGTNGNCTSCYKYVGHNYSKGYCSVCGKEEPGTRVIYFDNSSYGWTSVYAYAWDSYNNEYTGGWPGTKMTKVSGETNIYKVEISEEAGMIIFNDGGSNQTTDQALTSGKDLFGSGGWAVYTPSGSGSGSTGGDTGDDSGSTATTRTIYYNNSSTRWSNVYIYAWSGSDTPHTGSWPGAKMTKVSGESYIYSFEVPTDATNVIFSNGWFSQTADLTLPTGKDMYSGGTWTTYTAGSSGSTGSGTGTGSGSTTTTTTRTIYYDNSTTKWSNVYIYAWSGTSTNHTGSWPGTKMTLVSGESYVYSYEVPTDAVNVIFSDGGTNQTADLTMPTSKNLFSGNTWTTYTPGSTGGSSSSSSTRTIYFNSSAVNWSNIYVYTWSGSSTTHTGSWPGTKMTKVSGESNLYKITVSTKAEKIIFNNGSGTQTPDMAIPSVSSGLDLYSSTTSSWKTYSASSSSTTTTGTITLYCDATTAGWSKVYIYAWTGDTQYTGAWPGVAMPVVSGENGVYTYELTTEAENVIFNNGSGTQTSNLIVPDVSSGYNMYSLKDNCWTGYSLESAAYGLKDYTTAADATKHTFKANEVQVIAPTCDSNGYTLHTCSDCYYTYTDSYTNSTGHAYQTTSGSANQITRTCSQCGDSYTAGSIASGELFTLVGSNIVLGGELDMNFFIEPADLTGTDYYAVVTLHAQSGDITTTVPYAEWEQRTNYVVVTQKGLAARQMADEIDVVIYHGNGTQASVKHTDSIRSYAMRVLERQRAEAKTMLVDMLNYGAAAQNYFTYNTDDLANNQLTTAQQAYASQSVSCKDQRVQGTNYFGSTLTLESKIKLTMYFQNITTSMYAIISFTDHYGNAKSVRVEGSEFSKYNSTTYGVVVDDVVVADGDTVVSVAVYNAYGRKVAYASDSVNGYAVRKGSSHELFEKVQKFTTAAYTYLHSL
jgi:alpha-amylase